MRQVRKGIWECNRTERIKYIKILMSKGYTNEEALDIIEKRLFEYNPLGFSMDAMINRTVEKEVR